MTRPALFIEIADEVIERARADVAVVHYFDADRPLRGDAGRADWRLCGRISRLLHAGKLRGTAGEALLIPTGGGLAAPWLLALGLGSRNGFDADACAELGRDAMARARRLGATTVALPLPDPQAGDLELGERIESLVSGAIAALAEDSSDTRLCLVPPSSELPRTQKALAALIPRLRTASVAVLQGEDLPRADRGHPSPQGALGSSGPSRSSIK